MYFKNNCLPPKYSHPRVRIDNALLAQCYEPDVHLSDDFNVGGLLSYSATKSGNWQKIDTCLGYLHAEADPDYSTL